MIKSEKQLEIVREQLASAQAALDSIRREVRPKSEKMYQLMAESYIDMVLSLRAEIDAYLGIAPIPETADVVISLEGARVALGRISAGAVTRFIDTFRRGLQSTAEVLASVSRPETARRRERWIESACDLPIVGLVPGSVRILLGQPVVEGLVTDYEQEAFNGAIDVLFDALAWAGDSRKEDSASAFADLDAEKRQSILAVVTRLLPPRSGPIEQVSFQRRTGSDEGSYFRRAILTRESRDRVKHELAAIAGDKNFAEMEGVIRSVDLDAQTFTLRERPHDEPDMHCEYGAELEGAVKEYLNSRVLVSGILETNRKTQKKKMQADSIDSLASEEVGHAR